MEIEHIRPVWAEINLDNLAHNISEVKRIINKNTMIMAVVKADAYGHGDYMAAKTFLNNGADKLAVATLSEALRLRKKGITQPILILGYTPKSQAEELVINNITQTIYSYEQALTISNVAKANDTTGKIHIKIDTGMSRIGFLPIDNSIEEIKKIFDLPNLEIEGIFTHFATSDEKDKKTTEEQFEKFDWVVTKLESQGFKIPIKHVSNSAAIIDLPKYNLNMIRPGIILYGLYPSVNVNINKINVKPAMCVKANVSHVKIIGEGVGVSYGHTYTTTKTTKIATLPIGYADGFSRILSNLGQVWIKGKRVPVIGRICMDQCMVDVSNIESVKEGDEVIIFGDGREGSPHIDEVAKMLGTISYEVVTTVSKRVPRVYVQNGKIVEIVDYLLT